MNTRKRAMYSLPILTKPGSVSSVSALVALVSTPRLRSAVALFDGEVLGDMTTVSAGTISQEAAS